MARPQKYTVDYFSHDADASQGKTLSILFNHFGHDGISAWWQLLERVSSTNNHVISIRNPEEMEYLAAKMRFEPEKLKNILIKIAELGAIDKPLFETGCIWSQNLVDRLAPVYKARKQHLPTKPELILSETKLSVPETKLSVPVIPQTKLKETKVNNNKEKYKEKYGEFGNVLLSLEEYQKLIVKFTEPETKIWIEKLSAWKKSKGKVTKDDYATILNWSRRDGNNGQNQQSDKRNAIPGNAPTGAFNGLI